ncbi:CopG family transcriptional regulator [Rhodococcus sp. NPDC049939]|uniref:ribbon-helix-helix domain-containing protein n=1 Tax=Rhodococcus sp. NPDC049939 TaxID=3155511 RepID=UPI0033CF2025
MNKEIDEDYYMEAARAAEEMEIPDDWKPNALHKDAAQLETQRKRAAKVLGLGRPSLSKDAPAGLSPRRQVRLPKEVSDEVDRIAAESGIKPSEVMREAITLYVNALP